MRLVWPGLFSLLVIGAGLFVAIILAAAGLQRKKRTK